MYIYTCIFVSKIGYMYIYISRGNMPGQVRHETPHATVKLLVLRTLKQTGGWRETEQLRSIQQVIARQKEARNVKRKHIYRKEF